MALFSRQSPQEKILENFMRKDRYRILGVVGQGRTADILNAFDTSLNRFVAVKRLRREIAAEPGRVESFVDEIRLVGYLDHPGVVQVLDTFLDGNGTPCYAMKLVEGVTLGAACASKTRPQLLQIFTKLCETLAHIHDRGVVHLDLTPDNILMGGYGEVIITGWGCARMFDTAPYGEHLRLVKDAPPAPRGDPAGAPRGTLWYMSPEQIRRGREELTPSSDIFSLGVILYHMLVSMNPFGASSREETAARICEFNPPLMHEVNPEMPWALSKLCEKMIAKDPFSRYHSFHDVLVDLDKLQNSGQAFSARTYNQGDTIFEEGDPGEYAFTILAGQVEVLKKIDNRRKVLALLGKNETVGELAIFTGENRTATIRAAQPGTVIRIMGREDVELELRKLSPWVEQMISGLSKRFIDLNTKMIEMSRAVRK